MKSILLKTICTFTMAWATALLVQGQSSSTIWQWGKQLGGPGWDMPNGMASDSKGNIYVAGGFTDSLWVDGKAIKGYGNRDVYAAMFNEKGVLQWVWEGGGEGMDKVTAVKAAPDMGVIVAGIIEGSVMLGKKSVSDNGKQIFLSLLDAKGKSKWTTLMPFSGTASGYLLDVESNGNILLAGSFTDSLTSEGSQLTCRGLGDAFLARFNPDGTPVSLIQIGGKGRDFLTAMTASPDSGLFVAGTSQRQFNQDDINVPCPTNSKLGNSFLLAFDQGLKAQSLKTFCSESFSEITGLVTDSNNVVYMTGTFGSTLAYDTLKVCSQGLTDLFIAKCTGADSVQWLKTYGSRFQDASNGILRNLLGGVMITGSFADTLALDTLQLEVEGSSPNTFFAQFTANGKLTWAESMSGKGGNVGTCMAIDATGNIYLAGTFNGKLTTATTSFVSKGGEDVFMAKYHNCPSVLNAISGPSYLCKGSVSELTVDKGYYNITWNGVPGDNVYSLSAPGTYRVAMVDKKGCAITDSLEVGEAKPIAFTLGKDTTVAIGTKLPLTGPQGSESYLWQDGWDQREYIAQCSDGLPGVVEYSLAVTDSLGCTSSDSLNVEYYVPPGFANLNGGEELVTIYPCPVTETLYWSLTTERPVQLSIEVAGMIGNTVYREQISRYLPGETRSIPFGDLHSGNYVLTLSSGDQKISVSVVKK